MLGSVGIRVLGPTAVDDSHSLSPRDRVVLGALVVERGSVTAPDRLAEALWGDAVPGFVAQGGAELDRTAAQGAGSDGDRDDV